MAVSFVAAGAPARGIGVSTVPALPAGLVTDDLLILLDVAWSSTAGTPTTPGTPSGWAQKATFAGNAVRITWFYRRWVSGVTAPTVTGGTGSNEHRSQIVALRGAPTTGDPTDVIGTAATTASSSTALGTIAGITTTDAGGAVLVVGARGNDLTNDTAAFSTLSGDSLTWVELSEHGAESSAPEPAFAMVWDYALIPTARTITTKSFTITGNSVAAAGVGQMWAIASGVPAQTVTTSGIPSGEEWGSPTVTAGLGLANIPSGETFGSLTLAPGPISTTATGIPSAEAFGTPTLVPVISAVGIPSALAFGTLRLDQNITLTGIPSAGVFGSTTAQYLQTVTLPAGITSAEAWGKPTLIITIDTRVRGLAARPRYTPIYELLVMGRLPRESGEPTLLLTDPLDWQSLNWATTLSKPQSLSATCRISTITEPVRQRLRNPDRLPTELWLQRNGKTVFAGPLLGGVEKSDEITLEAGGLLTYLQWMYVTSDLRFKATDQFSIVAAMVNQWQNLSYGNFGIKTAEVGLSGVVRDLVLVRDEIHQVSRVVDELGISTNGFDTEIDPATRELQLWSPLKGVDRSVGPDAIVFDGQSIDGLGGVFSITPSDLASDAYGFGTGAETEKTFWSEQSNLELRITFGRTGVASSYSDIPNQGVLDNYVASLRDARGEPLRAPGKQVKVTPDTDLDDYDVGDVINYEISGLLGIGGAFRIRSRQVSVDQVGQETVTLEFT